MKSYLTKNILISLTLVWFLTISSSLFAINFNESRKVIRSQYSNAVYRDLTVLDTMNLNTKGDRTFLLELGKRPSYYWDSVKRFHLQQDQEIVFGNIFYNNSSNNNLYIRNMSVDGTLVTDGVTFNKSSSVEINGNGVLLLDYHRNFTARFLQMPTAVNVSAWNVRNTGTSESPSNVYLYMRDLRVGSQPFPNPRMFLWSQAGTDVRATGTATTFELKEDTASDIKNYYGPWEVAYNGSLPTDLSGTDPCDLTSTGDKCYRHNAGNNTDIYDTSSSLFSCVGKTGGRDNGIRDPEYYYTSGRHWCYDYQAVTAGAQNSAPGGGANNNTAYYEFKVQEIYRVEGNNATLVAQTPLKVRVDNESKIVPFWIYNGTNFNLNQVASHIFINGEYKSIDSITANNNDNPCYAICNGKSCPKDMVYVRSSSFIGQSLPASTNSVTNLWPEAEGTKQDIRIATFTVGFCPQGTKRTDYETNQPTQISKSWEGLQPNSKYYKMCIRRKVRCNMPASWQETSGTAQNDYKFFTTDY